MKLSENFDIKQNCNHKQAKTEIGIEVDEKLKEIIDLIHKSAKQCGIDGILTTQSCQHNMFGKVSICFEYEMAVLWMRALRKKIMLDKPNDYLHKSKSEDDAIYWELVNNENFKGCLFELWGFTELDNCGAWIFEQKEIPSIIANFGKIIDSS